jgi:hypothetical protein
LLAQPPLGCPSARRWTRPGQRTMARKGGRSNSGSEDPFRVSPECIAARATGIGPDPEISERSNQMRLRTIAAALVVAAPLLALGAPRPQLAGIQAMDIRLLLPPQP